MIQNVILASAIILALFTGWVLVQHLARRFAFRHPQFGPAREEGIGCGMACRCSAAEQEVCACATGCTEDRLKAGLQTQSKRHPPFVVPASAGMPRTEEACNAPRKTLTVLET